MATIRDILTDAYLEAGIHAPGESLSDENAAFGLSKLNRLLDRWNAERLKVYATLFSEFTFTPNLSPHTIGPTGTFVVSQRPVSIESAQTILNTVSPPVKTPIRMQDAAWWASVTVPGVTSTQPTDLYYNPTWPDGTLNFWPVPTIAYDVELQSRVLLASVGLNDTFSLPPGYQDAITLSVGEDLIPSYGVPEQTASGLRADARRARAIIEANNDPTPKLVTQDAGMPSGQESSTRTTWNYRTGLYNP